jgi:hypothetical protein
MLSELRVKMCKRLMMTVSDLTVMEINAKNKLLRWNRVGDSNVAGKLSARLLGFFNRTWKSDANQEPAESIVNAALRLSKQDGYATIRFKAKRVLVQQKLRKRASEERKKERVLKTHKLERRATMEDLRNRMRMKERTKT